MSIKPAELFAWVGPNELGDKNDIGLKQAVVPAGIVPMVAIAREKIDREDVRRQLETQARRYGNRISLVRFVAVEIVREVG